MKVKGTFYLRGKIKQFTGVIKQIGLKEKVIFDKKVGKIKSLDLLSVRQFELI